MEIELEESAAKILAALAAEEGVSESALLSLLLVNEDNDRHVVWSRKKMGFVRTKCLRVACKELSAVPQSDVAD